MWNFKILTEYFLKLLSDECEDNSTMIEHVCGKDPQNVMYVDAVSKQDLVPWYEMMVSWLSVWRCRISLTDPQNEKYGKKTILPYYWRLPYFDQTNLSKLYHPEIDQKYLITPSGSESIHRTSEHLLMSLYFLAWGLSCVSLQINTLVSIFSEEKNNYHLY